MVTSFFVLEHYPKDASGRLQYDKKLIEELEFSPFHHFSPFSDMYAPRCTLRTYYRAIWWSHLELGRGV